VFNFKHKGFEVSFWAQISLGMYRISAPAGPTSGHFWQIWPSPAPVRFGKLESGTSLDFTQLCWWNCNAL